MYPVSLALLALVVLVLENAAAEDDPQAVQEVKAQAEPKAADADAPLPLGFPDATRPGQIEVKEYPAYRSAVAKSDGATAEGGDLLFFWLFNHIQKREIAMTAPVINTYDDPAMLTEPGKRGNISMEFLYRDPDMGETGAGVGPVEVKDFPPARYVCLGFQGQMSSKAMKEAMDRINTWLDENKADWVAEGPPRRLGYHGPMTPANQRLWEVQVPVKSSIADGKDKE